MSWSQYQQQLQLFQQGAQSHPQPPQSDQNAQSSETPSDIAGITALDSILDKIDSKVKTTLDATLGTSSSSVTASNASGHADNDDSRPYHAGRDDSAVSKHGSYSDYSQTAHFNSRTGRFAPPQQSYPSQPNTTTQYVDPNKQTYQASQVAEPAAYYDPNAKGLRQMSQFFDVNAYQEQMQAGKGKAKRLTKAELEAIKQKNQARKKAKVLKEYGAD